MTPAATTTGTDLPEHSPCFDWISLTPDVFKALLRLDTAAKKDSPEALVTLIKIRASQLNRCIFCPYTITYPSAVTPPSDAKPRRGRPRDTGTGGPPPGP